jgi:hypothetical protein
VALAKAQLLALDLARYLGEHVEPDYVNHYTGQPPRFLVEVNGLLDWVHDKTGISKQMLGEAVEDGKHLREERGSGTDNRT